MLLKIYRGTGPGTIILILFSLILLWLQPLLNPVEASVYNDYPAPLYTLLIKIFEGRPFAATIFSMLMVIAIAIYLVNFNTRLFFINERTFLPASLYVLLSAYIPDNQVFNPVLPASFLLLVAIDRLAVSYRKQGIAFSLFDASMLIGLASLFYTNIIWFYILILIGISLFRTFSVRELLISLAGLLTPLIILYSFYYLTGRDIPGLNSLLVDSMFSKVPGYQGSTVFIIISSVNLLIFVLSLLHMLSVFNTKKVRSRKIFSLLIWMGFLTVLIYFLVPAASVGMMYVMLLPLVYILSHYLVTMRNKKIANYVFAIIFLSVVFLQVNRAILI